jgi:hypothetical protein
MQVLLLPSGERDGVRGEDSDSCFFRLGILIFCGLILIIFAGLKGGEEWRRN